LPDPLIRKCCIDRLSWHDLPGVMALRNKQLLAAGLIQRIGKGVSRDPRLYFTQLANGGE